MRFRFWGPSAELDVLVNNASDLGPVPLALLADTEPGELEEALSDQRLGPFRLTKACSDLRSLGAGPRRSAGRQCRHDAAVNAYASWGAYSASKAGRSA